MKDYKLVEDDRQENGEYYDYANPKNYWDVFYLLSDLL